jgi:chemotaxis family two-component system response regulator PixH
VTRSQRILIVTDSMQSEAMQGALGARRFSVTVVVDYESAYLQLRETRFTVVVIDLVEVAEGVEFIKRVRAAADLTQPLLLVIAEWGTGAGGLALTQGADAYEPKPIDDARLVDSVERLLGTKAVSAWGTRGAE